MLAQMSFLKYFSLPYVMHISIFQKESFDRDLILLKKFFLLPNKLS